MRLLPVSLCLLLLSAAYPSHAQEYREPCKLWTGDLSPELPQPWMRPELPCLELAVEDAAAGELAFTALAAAPDGTLFAARPYTGEVFALVDTDGEGLPDTPRLIAEGLTLPNGLAYAEDALYISAGESVWRWRADEGAIRILDDLPTGAGAWTGGVAVSEDALYVAVGTGQGDIWRYPAAGGAHTVFARGLLEPADLLISGGALFALDAVGDALYRFPLDLADGEVYGVNGAPGGIEMPPAFRFPPESQPLGIAAYTGDAMPSLAGQLLVTLGGSSGRVDLRGYAVVALTPDFSAAETLLPAAPEATGAFAAFDALRINQYGAGFFPHRPLDVAVSAGGGVLISVGGGRILSIRAF